MSTTLRHEFSLELAKLVLDDIQYQRSKYYYFLGNIGSWGASDIAPTTTLLDTSEENNKLRSEIAFIKRIAPGEVSLVALRYDWASGEVFDYWDQTIDMEGKRFYVVTDEFHVYKCLDNGNGAPSTIKPFGTSVNQITLADGYVWKYMYTIPSFKRSRFTSVSHIPVQRAVSDSFYNNGSVDAAVVLTPGSGYTDAQLTFLVVSGATTGTGALGTVTLGAGGVITGVTITNGGTGYTNGVKVTFGGTGAGATGTAVVAAGVITGVTITNGGAGYTAGAGGTVTFSVGGAVLLPVINSVGTIVDVIIKDAGIGYTGNPTVAVTGTGGTGKYVGNANAIVQTVAVNGAIDRVNVLDPGIGYPVDSSTTISVQGDGVDAAFKPVVFDGKLVDVIVENPGTGYTEIALTVNSSTGSGATVRGVVTESDYNSNQIIVEQSAVFGAIYKVRIDNMGKSYSPGSYIEVTGNGTGFAATPTFDMNGGVSKITVTNPGSGYSYANVRLVDPLRGDEIIAAEDKFVGTVMLPPNGGHGVDAVTELFGKTLSINTALRNELVSTEVLQDFRTFGLLKNPKSITTGVEYTSQSALGMYQVRFNTLLSLVKDEVLVFNSNKYRVVDWDVGTNYVYLIPIDKETVQPLGVLAAETNNTRQYTADKINQSVTFNRHSGRLLYVSTENPFVFNDDQSVVFKTYITF